MLEDMQQETGMLLASGVSSVSGVTSTSAPASHGKKSAHKAAGKSKAVSSKNVVLEATRFKTRTVKSFKDCLVSLEKALDVGQKAVDESVAMSDDQTGPDVVSGLMRQRLDMVRLALHGSGSTSLPAADALLWALVSQDPYMKDLQTTILSKESCKCYKSLSFERNVSLNVHSSTESLQHAMDAHVHAIDVLRRLADCLHAAATDWRASTTALKKAHRAWFCA